MNRAALAALFAFLVCAGATARESSVVRIGSKNFTEQEILAEIVSQVLERTTDLEVRRRFGLGGTDICHAAMLSGELDLYVEYTGTGLLSVLRAPVIKNPAEAFRAVAGAYRERFDLEWLPPLGFNNTYALCVRESDAKANGWASISNLAPDAPELRAGFTSEFIERPDGLPGLRRAYALEFGSIVDLDPGLMYTALAEGQVDVIAAFATDGRIAAFALTTLEDDRAFFPPYDAAPVVRADLLREHPEVRDALAVLAGAIDDGAMREMNRQADVLKRAPRDIAREWVDARLGPGVNAAPRRAGAPTARKGFLEFAFSRRAEVGRKTVEHLVLTALGTSIAVLIGVPLGVLIRRRAVVRAPVLALTEIVQTVPSLAMLAFLFAVYGLLGAAPAVTALVLYALLPIVLNTSTGLREVPPRIVQAADGVGMSPWQRLRMVELPLASPVIVAGIRAATVLTVGIATLSTYIGAGGLGDFIARGLARNDPRLTLLGAVPAALMAVVLSLMIRLVERALRLR